VIVQIDDADDPRIADYRNVLDPELIQRLGVFVAEGRLVVRRLLTSDRLGARSVMVTDVARASLQDLLDTRSELPVYIVRQTVMNSITGFNIHRGCLAIGERPAPCDWRELARAAKRLLALERVTNADNVGSLFRNAAAFGVDAVLLGPGCADPLYRKAIRTSVGASLTTPFSVAEPWPEALHYLRTAGVVSIGMTPSASAPLEGVARHARGQRVMIVIGHEGEGLSPEALGACDWLARIPMAEGVDSINVATAAAVALYEITRSR